MAFRRWLAHGPLTQDGRTCPRRAKSTVISTTQRTHARSCQAKLHTITWLLFTAAQTLCGQVTNIPPNPLPLLTDISEIWGLPRDRKTQPHRIQTEVMIYYFDAEWNVVWGECQGKPVFLPIADCPVSLKAGQRVALDGVVMPFRQAFLWDQTQVRILEEGRGFPALPIRKLDEDPHAFKGRVVSVEGLVDRMLPNAGHVNIDFLAGKALANLYVRVSTNSPPLHFKEGDFVRVKCVYGAQFNREGGLRLLSLWAVRPEDVEVIGSLATDPRFSLPVTASEDIAEEMPQNTLIRVEGVVRRHDAGQELVIWDATGQVTVQSQQTLPLRVGDRVEAIGYPNSAGVERHLRVGLYRPAVSPNLLSTPVPDLSGRASLRLAEWIRDLNPADARRRLPVKLRGVVTWSHPQTPFAYVEDASGGIRVLDPKWLTPETSKPGSVVELQGEVVEGDYVPVVTNVVAARVGWWDFGQPKQVTLEQAMTGAEDGRWVEMRGYVREVSQVKDLVRLDLSTARGEFQAWVPTSESQDSLRGSVIRVRGVCSVVANARHQLIGIEVWVAGMGYVVVDEASPGDPFATPLRTLDNLRRFDAQSMLGRRVRTSGIVILHSPGHHLYVQEGDEGVFVLSRQQDELQPGDRVEVVGFPGNEGRRFLLREAVYRRIGAGTEPAPAVLPEAYSVNADLEGLLTIGEGILLNATDNEGEVRLMLQTPDSAFEASVDSMYKDPAKQLAALRTGSRLSVTGVYEVQRDDYGRLRSFLLRLRSWEDVSMLRQPPWWTLSRLLWMLLALLAVAALAVGWGLLISRKNMLLQQAQTDLQAAHDRLETRVQERTHDLQEQVQAKERAHAKLAEAQHALMLASRKAGMAEVATGVLHNVGNVLNSVNVSAALLDERLRQNRTENAAKAVALLRQPPDQLTRFLSGDPKGKHLPTYFEQLFTILQDDRDFMRGEVSSLVKNVEHIKVIVAMQQGYVRFAGVLEPCDPRELVEDAVQINAASLDRHQIELVRDFQPTPRILADRHKILQVLVNLINNAKHALDDKPSNRRIVLKLGPVGSEQVHISVNDNGVGIAPENLSRIFSQGFTTKKTGHGFGLHSGANAAKELGGSLSVHSDGLGKGATFTLGLPATGQCSPSTAPPPTPPANL